MYLRKAQAGSAPGLTWEEDGDVIEVEDNLAEQLLRIPRGGFSIAEAPQPEPETPQQFDDAFEQGEPVEVAEDETPKKKGGRPPLPRDAAGNIIRN